MAVPIGLKDTRSVEPNRIGSAPDATLVPSINVALASNPNVTPGNRSSSRSTGASGQSMPAAMSLDFTPSPFPSSYEMHLDRAANALESNGHVGVVLERLHTRARQIVMPRMTPPLRARVFQAAVDSWHGHCPRVSP